MITTAIGFLHLSVMILENIYGMITIKMPVLDNIYVFSIIGVSFSWILCKDECLISYWIKKYEHPEYILGESPENVSDISDLFPNKELYLWFYHIGNVCRVYSVFLVNGRSIHISSWILHPTMILYIFYVYDILYNTSFRKWLFPYFQIVFGYYLSKMGYHMFHKIINTKFYLG